jgi:hypothetical protein
MIVTIPATVEIVGKTGFSDCSALEIVRIEADSPDRGGSAPRKQAPRMPRIAIGVDLEDRAQAAESCARSGPVHGHVIMLINETISSLLLLHLVPFRTK